MRLTKYLTILALAATAATAAAQSGAVGRTVAVMRTRPVAVRAVSAPAVTVRPALPVQGGGVVQPIVRPLPGYGGGLVQTWCVPGTNGGIVCRPNGYVGGLKNLPSIYVVPRYYNTKYRYPAGQVIRPGFGGGYGYGYGGIAGYGGGRGIPRVNGYVGGLRNLPSSVIQIPASNGGGAHP